MIWWYDDDDDSNDDNMVGNGARANGAENIVDDRYPANANDVLLRWTDHIPISSPPVHIVDLKSCQNAP